MPTPCLHLVEHLDLRFGGVAAMVPQLTRAITTDGRYAPVLCRESTEPASVVHAHGLWRSQTRVGAQMSRRADARLVVSAHGMLDAWALRNKRWKKVAYGFLERANLRR